MYLLKNHNPAEIARKVPLESMSLQLKERDASATIVPAETAGLKIGAWLQDETQPGKNIVWRIKSMSTAYHSDTVTVQLEHAVAALRDILLFGSVTPAMITGKASATACTAKQAANYILSKSPDWTLGSFGYDVTNPYKFDGETLFDALETVTNSLSGAMWTYDFTTYPFRLNITPANDTVASELRLSRNIRTITRSVDKSGMFTRFYPIGANDLHITGNYVDKNTAAYGIICKVETDNSIGTEAELRRWANERLANHAEPTVTIDVEGFELASATGESLDRMNLGRICRVPLPEYGTTIQERITALNYPDKIKQPEIVKVTLANNKTDVTKIIADAMKKSGKSARTSTKKDKEDLAWFEDTNDHVSMCAIGIIGVDAQGKPNWKRLTDVTADGTGMHSVVSDLKEDVKDHETRLDQDERSIGMVVGNYDSSGRYIRAGQICLAINEDNSATATIKASKIYLLGETIAKKITADYIHGKIAAMNSVTVNKLLALSAKVMVGGSWVDLASTTYVHGCPWDMRIEQSGNTYKLQWKRLGYPATWTDIGSFSRATSLSGEWSGSTYTVTASPQGNTISVTPQVKLIEGENTYTTAHTATQSGGSWAYHATFALYLVQDGLAICLRNTNGTSNVETYAKRTVSIAKSDIAATRGSRSASDTTHDATLTTITQNGYYNVSVTVGSTTKTFRIRANVTT